MADLLAEPAPAASRPPVAQGVGVRVIVLGWCLWLLGSWAVTLTLDSPVPAARWMIFSALIGLMVVWPAVRLSQDTRGSRSIFIVLADWFCLLLILQAIIWPLRLVAGWSWQQALWIDASLAAWSLLTAAIVAAGRQLPSSVARAGAMALCLLLMLAVPLTQVLLGGSVSARLGGEWAAGLHPIATLWHLTGPGLDLRAADVMPPIITVAIAALVAWVGVALLSPLLRRAQHDLETPRDPQNRSAANP